MYQLGTRLLIVVTLAAFGVSLFACDVPGGGDGILRPAAPQTMQEQAARELAATAVIWVVGGLGVWLFAQPLSNHAGASVLIFGWIVYLVVRGFLNRRSIEIFIGVAVFLLYSSVLLGVLPGQPGVSWQGHLFGAIGGFLAARLLTTRVRGESSITY